MDRKWHRRGVIYDHLICSGPSPGHVKWICDVSQTEIGMDFGDNLDAMFNCTGKKFEYQGEREQGPNAEAKRFYDHVKEANNHCILVALISPA